MASSNRPGFLAHKHRVVFSLFRAVCRIGMRLRLPLGDLEMLLRMAYFREAREEHGLELGDIAELFGKSLRTVSTLHKQYRSDFFAPEEEVQLRRDIAEQLNHRPATDHGLRALFRDRSEADLRRAVDDLVREGRILRTDGALRRNPEDHDFFANADLTARIDGLNRQMDILAETVHARLIDERKDALARSYVFSASDGDLHALYRDLLAFLRERAIAADTAAQDCGIHNRRALTLAATTLEEGA